MSNKRLSTDEDFNKICEAISKATSISEIPVLDENVYFTFEHSRKICNVAHLKNPFLAEIELFCKKLDFGRKNDYETFLQLKKSENLSISETI